MQGKNLGIIGYGTIGKRVAEIARVFGMNILIAAREGVVYNDFNRLSINDLLKESDILTIHTPLSPDTINMIGKSEFETMKNSAFLINTGRGGIVNEIDLYQALKNKQIAGAAVDVLSEEPPKNNPLLGNIKNLIITPHCAWTAIEARQRLVDEAAKNIKAFIDGRERNIVKY